MRLPTFSASKTQSRREQYRAALSARRTWRTAMVVGVAVIGGLAAALFARLCDGAMKLHAHFMTINPWLTLLLLPIGFPLLTWLTRKVAPEAAGSGIPQVIAAAEQRWTGRWGGPARDPAHRSLEGRALRRRPGLRRLDRAGGASPCRWWRGSCAP